MRSESCWLCLAIRIQATGLSFPVVFMKNSSSLSTVFICLFFICWLDMLAGFTFRNSERVFRIGYRKWIKEKAERLLVPYFVVSLIAVLPKSVVEHTSAPSGLRQIVNLVLYPRLGVWGHFWFIPTLFFVYALYGAWMCWKGGGSGWHKCVITFFVAGIIYFAPWSNLLLCFDDVKTAMLFFALGMGIRDIITKIQLLQSGLSAFLSVVCGASASLTLNRAAPGTRWADCVIALLMFFSLWKLGNIVGDRRIIRWLSMHNFTMFLYSWPFQAVVMDIGNHMGIAWQTVSALMFFVGLCGPVILVTLFERRTQTKSQLPALLLGLKRG